MKRFILLSLSFLIASSLFAQLLNENPNLKTAAVSYLVMDAETGEELLSFDANESMMPASVMKIVPTASALDKYGKDAVFTTRLMYTGEIKEGVLHGDLYIVGGGDPALGSLKYKEHYYKPVSFLQSWVGDVKRAGIKRVNGNVYGVENENLINKVPRTWIWEDMANHFGANPGMLNVYDNLYHIHFNTQGAVGDLTEITGFFPSDISYEFDNQVRIKDGGGDQAYIFGAPDSNQRLVKGTLPQGYSQFVVKGSIANPALLIAEHFHKHLVDAGVPVSGEAACANEKGDMILLASLDSPDLEALCQITNHKSINLYANMIGCLFSDQFVLEDASAKITAYWKAKGMDTQGLYLEDLCGLSPFNQISARQVGFILKSMQSSVNYDAFFQSLPVSGESGTLRYFGHNKSFKGKFHGKSGSIKRVYAYAGYMTSSTGKSLIVVSMINKFPCTSREAKASLVDFYDYVYQTY